MKYAAPPTTKFPRLARARMHHTPKALANAAMTHGGHAYLNELDERNRSVLTADQPKICSVTTCRPHGSGKRKGCRYAWRTSTLCVAHVIGDVAQHAGNALDAVLRRRRVRMAIGLPEVPERPSGGLLDTWGGPPRALTEHPSQWPPLRLITFPLCETHPFRILRFIGGDQLNEGWA